MNKKGTVLFLLVFALVFVSKSQTSIKELLEEKFMVYRESMFGYLSPTIAPAYEFSFFEAGGNKTRTVSKMTAFIKFDLLRYGYNIKYNLLEFDMHRSISFNINPRLDYSLAYQRTTEMRFGIPISVAYNSGVAASKRALLERGWSVELGIEYSTVILSNIFAPENMYYLNSYFYNNNKVPVENGEDASIMSDFKDESNGSGILVRRRTVYPFFTIVKKSFGKGWLFRKSRNYGALDLYFTLGNGAGLDFRNSQGEVNRFNQTTFRIGLRKNFRYM